MSADISGDYANQTVSILGPRFFSAVIQGLETGLISNLAYRFWKEDYAEKTLVKFVMFFVTLLSYIQTILTFYTLYEKFVLNFGDWTNMLQSTWRLKGHLLLIFLLAMPAKALFIRRCYSLARKKHKRYILSFLGILFAGEITAWILVSVMMFSKSFDRGETNDAILICSLVFPLALNVALSCTFMVLILPYRPRVFSKSITKTIYRCSFIVWEANIPSAISIFIAFVLYLALVPPNRWAYLPQDIVGQMYIISLFVVLMGMQMAPTERIRRRPNFSLTSLNMTWRRAVRPLSSPSLFIPNPTFFTVICTQQDNQSATCAPGFELSSLPTSLRSGLSSIDFDPDSDMHSDLPVELSLHPDPDSDHSPDGHQRHTEDERTKKGSNFVSYSNDVAEEGLGKSDMELGAIVVERR